MLHPGILSLDRYETIAHLDSDRESFQVWEVYTEVPVIQNINEKNGNFLETYSIKIFYMFSQTLFILLFY